jgi:hypothetical protein
LNRQISRAANAAGELKNAAGAAMDMGAGPAKTAPEYMPDARALFDHFHVAQPVSKAADEALGEDQSLPRWRAKKIFSGQDTAFFTVWRILREKTPVRPLCPLCQRRPPLTVSQLENSSGKK